MLDRGDTSRLDGREDIRGCGIFILDGLDIVCY